MARHDSHFRAAAIVHRSELLRSLPERERDAFVRFLAGGKDWRQAARELSGAFADNSLSPLGTGGKE